MRATSLEDLCHRLSTGSATELSALLPTGIQQEVGHFNIFSVADLPLTTRDKPAMPYPCRTYYKSACRWEAVGLTMRTVWLR